MTASNLDQRIKEYITNTLKSVGHVSSMSIRKEFNVGWTRARRILDEFFEKKLIVPHSLLGWVSTERKVVSIQEDVETYEKSRIIDLERTIQKERDDKNYYKKLLREENRIDILQEKLITALENNITPYENKFIPVDQHPDHENVAIIQLSDLHLNESVDPKNVKGVNEYNWKIASKRLKKYADRCKKKMESAGTEKIIIALTGDLYNSNRRYDEIVDNMDSLAVAVIIGSDLISKFIMDVSQGRYTTVYSVFGNESRIREEYTANHWEHNFDFINHYMMKYRLEQQENIFFNNPTYDHSVVIKDVLGANILLIHGHNRTSFEKELVKFAHDPHDPIIIHYMLHGHVHETKISHNSKRSASLVGSNSYSYNMLGLPSYAEQNIHFIIKETDKRIPIMETTTINLDHTGDIEGYDLIRDSLQGQTSRRGKHSPNSKFFTNFA
jgi:hypothetical protein